jgi:hypothetical protein
MPDCTYKPAEVAKITGISTELQRSLRHRGVGIGGAAINGRFNFSSYDVLEAAIFASLVKKMTNDEAWRITLWVSALVAKKLGFQITTENLGRDISVYAMKVPVKATEYRFALFAMNENPIFCNDPSIGTDFDSSVITLIDIEKLSNDIPINNGFFISGE